MDIFEKVDLHDCPICGGPSLLEEERGSGFYISCLDCGAHTVCVRYGDESEDKKLEAAETAANLWNTGKAISSSPGE